MAAWSCGTQCHQDAPDVSVTVGFCRKGPCTTPTSAHLALQPASSGCHAASESDIVGPAEERHDLRRNGGLLLASGLAGLRLLSPSSVPPWLTEYVTIRRQLMNIWAYVPPNPSAKSQLYMVPRQGTCSSTWNWCWPGPCYVSCCCWPGSLFLFRVTTKVTCESVVATDIIYPRMVLLDFSYYLSACLLCKCSHCICCWHCHCAWVSQWWDKSLCMEPLY